MNVLGGDSICAVIWRCDFGVDFPVHQYRFRGIFDGKLSPANRSLGQRDDLCQVLLGASEIDNKADSGDLQFERPV